MTAIRWAIYHLIHRQTILPLHSLYRRIRRLRLYQEYPWARLGQCHPELDHSYEGVSAYAHAGNCVVLVAPVYRLLYTCYRVYTSWRTITSIQLTNRKDIMRPRFHNVCIMSSTPQDINKRYLFQLK